MFQASVSGTVRGFDDVIALNDVNLFDGSCDEEAPDAEEVQEAEEDYTVYTEAGLPIDFDVPEYFYVPEEPAVPKEPTVPEEAVVPEVATEEAKEAHKEGHEEAPKVPEVSTTKKFPSWMIDISVFTGLILLLLIILLLACICGRFMKQRRSGKYEIKKKTLREVPAPVNVVSITMEEEKPGPADVCELSAAALFPGLD